MRTSLFFIVLGFIRICYCVETNLSLEDSSCSIPLHRNKRTLKEYTRWRANQPTKGEFIVKVDDEIITTLSLPIVAVNIQPMTKASEKIIIGGAIVPPPKTPDDVEELPREYTRFVPPTTTVNVDKEGDTYLSPVLADENLQEIYKSKYKASLPKYPKHANRDESPPAAPQFLPRSPDSRQYAPITPVAFNKRLTSHSPPPMDYPMFPKSSPDHTSYSPSLLVPTRTRHEETNLHDVPVIPPSMKVHPLDSLLASLEEDSELSTQKTSHFEDDLFTTIQPETITEPLYDGDIKPTRRSLDDKESDGAYNMLLYNDDNEIGKKEAQDYNEEKGKGNDSEIIENELNEDDEKNIDDGKMSDDDNKIESELKPEVVTRKTANITLSTAKLFGVATIEVTTTLSPSLKNKRRHVCNLLKFRPLNFNAPRTLPEIHEQLKRWTEDSPIAKLVDITDENYTTMENPIYMMMIDDPSSGQIISAKQTVMIVSGIQGRDHHAVSSAMYVLYQLIERSEAHADLLSKFRFWIIPVFNPDGYDYSMTFPHRRDWTKNLRQSWDTCKGRESCQTCEVYGLRCTTQPCYGVNLDRNFEYQWIPTEELRAEHPCGDLYAGSRQLSEHETQALTRFMHEQHTPLYTFIAFKEGEVLGVMYPYSHTRKRRSFDHVYRQRASRAAAAAYSISGRPYVAGQTSEFLPLYAGGIEDWVDGHLGIDNTYTIMMYRPTDSYSSKLMTERVVHEAYAAMDTLLLQSVEPLGPPSVQLTRKNAHVNTQRIEIIALGAIFIAFCHRLN